MHRFVNHPFFVGLVYTLMSLLVLFMLVQINPIIAWIYAFLKAVLAPFLIAMIISYVLNPIVRILNERKVPRTAAVLIIYAVFITSISVIMMNLIPVFMKQLREVNEHMPQLTMKAQNIVEGMNQSSVLPESVRQGVNDFFEKMEAMISKSIANVVNEIGATIDILFIAVIVPFLAFYMLKDYHLFEKKAISLVPTNHKKKVIHLIIDIDHALGNYVRGQFIVCIIVGLLSFLGYWLIGLPYPLLLASIVAVFNIIPYLGPFFGAAPAIIMASTISFKLVLYVVGINLLIQILEGNVVSPQVVGKSLHLHPMLIILALLIGGQIAGIVGLILAVPLFAVLKVVFQHTYYYVKQRSV